MDIFKPDTLSSETSRSAFVSEMASNVRDTYLCTISINWQTTEVSYKPFGNIQAHSVNNTINVHPYLDCNSIKSRKQNTKPYNRF